MHPQTYAKTVRPGLNAAMTAGRALLAAGWRYDSTSPMADDTTIRTLLHPSGREIHARTVDGDERTDLTLTGLSLEQVAGAVTGAGLAPSVPASVAAESDPRQVAWQLVINGVAGGLPIPAAVQIPGHYDLATIRLPRNDTAGVDAWASYLSLPKPRFDDEPLEPGLHSYGVEMEGFPTVSGWHISVQCFCTEGGTR